MIIEFADPGYNWAWLWVPLGICFGLVALTALVGKWVDWDMSDPLFGIVGPLAMASVVSAAVLPGMVGGGIIYPQDVSRAAETALFIEGFSNVQVTDDRFTAKAPDGEYFSGILVDLEPESGYAYQVLEITDTPTK